MTRSRLPLSFFLLVPLALLLHPATVYSLSPEAASAGDWTPIGPFGGSVSDLVFDSTRRGVV